MSVCKRNSGERVGNVHGLAAVQWVPVFMQSGPQPALQLC